AGRERPARRLRLSDPGAIFAGAHGQHALAATVGRGSALGERDPRPECGPCAVRDRIDVAAHGPGQPARKRQAQAGTLMTGPYAGPAPDPRPEEPIPAGPVPRGPASGDPDPDRGPAALHAT